MRIAMARRWHEANTFSTSSADLAAWERQGILLGDAFRRRHDGSQSAIAGFLSWEQEQKGFEIVPIVDAQIVPTGTSTNEAFEHVVGILMSQLEADGPWDGVLLSLHGAAVSEGHLDADGEVLRRVRALVGLNVPIGVTLDMHANVSDLMVSEADIITVYQTNPHVDAFEQGLACARLLGRALRGEIHPEMSVVRPPVAINILRQGTDDEPMRGLLARAQDAAQRSGVLGVYICEGFPYADVPEMGMAAVVLTDGEPELSRRVAFILADAMWDARHDMVGLSPTAEEALRIAAAQPRGPVLILDMGDNVGGGSAGDSTFLLHAARATGVTQITASLCDSEVVRLSQQAGVGGRIETDIGARTDEHHGAPFFITGEVIALADGKFEDLTPTHGGLRYFDVGATAGIRTDEGMLLAVHSYPCGGRSRMQWRIAGIEPDSVPIVLAKGVHAPRAAFEPVASRLIWADTAGVTAAGITALEYRHRLRPMFPFEAGVRWQHLTHGG